MEKCIVESVEQCHKMYAVRNFKDTECVLKVCLFFVASLKPAVIAL